MCSKKYGKESKMLCKALLVSLFLLCVVVSQLAAWPIKPSAAKTENVSQEETPVSIQTILEMPSTISSDSSEKISATASTALRKSSPISEGEYAITEEQYAKLVAELTALKGLQEAAEATESIEDELDQALAEENKNLKESHAAALELNAEQADEIADLAAEAKSKAYITVGGLLGFEDNLPTYGVYGKIGTKIGKSLLLEAGAEYDLGTLSDPLRGIRQPSLNNMRVTAGIGWLF